MEIELPPNRLSTRQKAPSNATDRTCADCKKSPQVQCLHCSKQVCISCAQKHIDLASEQVNVAQHLLNEKISILDRLSATAKELVDMERNKIIKQADVQRARALDSIDQLVEHHKERIKSKNSKLNQLPLDAIPTYIQDMADEFQYINEGNTQWLRVITEPPTIHVEDSNQGTRRQNIPRKY